MNILRVALAGAVAASAALAADEVLGDARRGEQLFQTEQCIQCHSINGRGGALAPDLGKRIDRDFTPTVMASLIWNHAPQMWSAMRRQGIVRATLSPESAADLFAYFVSARFFEKPGDAGRGKQVFAAKHCADCHGVTASNAAGAPPVVKWASLADPTVLIQQMWNHGGQMRQAYAEKKLKWSPLTSQELRDMLVYLQNLPETRELVTAFEFPPSASGSVLFESKGCAGCHKGNLALENRLRNQNLTDIAVDMWNHQANMKQPAPNLSQEEMRQILGYVWTRQYFRGSGDAAHGRQVFTEKSCAACHNDASSGAPPLAKTPEGYSDISMISALWQHGPRMLDLMTERKLAWPRFTAPEMADLIAYLNSR
ncbi:MAG TPA: c-type cytochrome [Bryobacteraceae bacterium]|nr:c-type cytochrome [Bryobacteraceae bacterium]